jgi:hypothetical protein
VYREQEGVPIPYLHQSLSKINLAACTLRIYEWPVTYISSQQLNNNRSILFQNNERITHLAQLTPHSAPPKLFNFLLHPVSPHSDPHDPQVPRCPQVRAVMPRAYGKSGLVRAATRDFDVPACRASPAMSRSLEEWRYRGILCILLATARGRKGNTPLLIG